MIEKIDNLIKNHQWEKYLTKTHFNYLVIICFGLLGLFLNWSLKDTAATLALIWLFLFQLKSQVMAKIAALCLLMTPLMMFANNSSRAEIFSELGYLFLIFTVIRLIIEYYKEDKEKSV